MVLRKTFGEKAFDAINLTFLIFLCAVMLYPILFVCGQSLMSDAERAINPLSIFPKELDLSGYRYILGKGSLLLSGYQITLFRTIIGTILSLLVESMMAYVLAKESYPLRKQITMLIVFTMWFSGGLIPSFLLLKSLGFFNSIWVFIFPRLASAWNILILRNFFAQIPESLEEAARIDGANEITVLFRVILPLSLPALATVGLFHVVYHWNEWFTGIIYITDTHRMPVMVILRRIIAEANQTNILDFSSPEYAPPTVSIQMATIVMVAFPIIAAYPFFQKYFTEGMLIGAVKG